MRRWGVVAVGLALMASACSDGSSPAVGPASVESTAAPEPTASPGPITLSIVLDDDEVPAGTTITGFLVFENTGPQVDIIRGECALIWGVALGNADIAPSVDFTEPCVMEPLRVPTGQSQVPITILTTRGGDPLPPGEYETVLVFSNTDLQLGGPPPAPVKVTLTD